MSNTLFRREAGELQAYLVDAETAELYPQLSDGQRAQDLDVLEENVAGELSDVAAEAGWAQLDPYDTAREIRARYERLWAEITREVTIAPAEAYRIHERIRALNDLGFSVGEISLVTAGEGQKLRVKTIVTDRDYHRHQLHTLTGLVAGEPHARVLVQEILEVRATLAREKDQSVPLSVAAFRWLDERFHPVAAKLAALARPGVEVAELYCHVLEHKWYLGEAAGRDVGMEAALADFLARFGPARDAV